MKRLITTGILAAALIVPTAAQASSAPNVRCQRLDRAESTLHNRGFRTVERGGGLFGIVLKADWVVVNEHQSGSTVTLTVGRYC
jgi:hypothetical protein